MYRQKIWMDVKVLHRQGSSIRAIARRTGLSRATVRKILREPVAKPYAPRPARVGKLDPFVERRDFGAPWHWAAAVSGWRPRGRARYRFSS